MNHTFSFRERFIGLPNPKTGDKYAPMTIGAPKFLHQTNYKEFKKEKNEKELTRLIVKQHKKDLIAYYGKGNINKHMNPKGK